MRKSIIYGIRKLLFVGLLLVCILDVFSQGHVYKHYGVEEGLPSSEVYSAFQDSKGYIWFATDAGVSRFNGYEFENFDVSDGLTDNTVFLITEDTKNRVWFGTFNCQLSYYDYTKGGIFPFQYNNEIAAVVQEKKVLNSFYVDDLDNVWLGFYNSNKTDGMYRCTSAGVVESLLKNAKNSMVRVDLVDDNQLVWGTRRGTEMIRLVYEKNSFDELFSIDLHIEKPNENVAIIYEHSQKRKGQDNFTMSLMNNDLFIGFGKDFIYVLEAEKQYQPQKKYLPLNLGNDRILTSNFFNNHLYLCIENEGVYKSKIEGDSIVIVEHYLKNQSVARIFKDREGGTWFMTLKEGVYYMSNEMVRYSGVDNVKLIALDVDTVSGVLYGAYDDWTLKKITAEKAQFHYNTISTLDFICQDLSYNYGENLLLIGGKLGAIQYYQDGKDKFIRNIHDGTTKAFLVDSNIIYRVNGFGLTIIENQHEVYSSIKEQEPKMWCTSLIKKDSQIWIGTNDGVRIYQDGKITNPFLNQPLLSSSVTSIEHLNSDLMLIGTKSFGLLVMEEGRIVDVINEEKGLVNNLVREIHVDNQKIIWVGTSRGLSRILYKGVSSYEVFNLTKNHGLVSAEIGDICSFENTIYALTSKGLIYFDKREIHLNKAPPTVYISSFKVNEKTIKLEEDNEFSYNDNNVNIVFEALNYRSVGDIQYQYRMLGVDTNWVTTTTRDVRYPTLHFGDYTFQVKASNEDGVWNENPSSLKFSILPPFWFTWWFTALVILFIIVTVGMVFFYREKKIVEKNEETKIKAVTEKKIIELELRALRSQMNPHFIFNILNSIQHYILVNDFRSTNKYITSFAKLIRTVLHLSEKSMITIQEELDMLDLYMNLEKMRFDEQFSFEIDVSKDIDVNYDEIPSMLIQPYVENSIWHGLMNKSKKGEIKIKLYLKEDYLCCSIQDNGIGREKANEIKERRRIGQKSVGMSITNERLDIFSENDVNVITTDLKDELGNAIGTKVQIRIPYKN